MLSLSGLAVIFLVLHFGRSFVICFNVTADANIVTWFLLQLHKDYCGISNLCAANSTNTEPDIDQFPMPCCMPCSCSSTCDSMHLCCPYYTSLSSGTLDKPDSALQRINDEMQKFENSSNTMINNAIDSNTADLNIPGGKVECIRAQVYYRVNWRPDSQAFEMVTSCPRRNQTHSSKAKCEERYNSDNLYDFVPVTSPKSGKSYINKFCLFCNEPNDNFDRHLLFWKTFLVSKLNSFSTMFFESPQTIYETLKSPYHRSNIHFAPVFPGMAKTCEPFDVTSCNVTGLWVQYNKTLNFVCLFGESLPIIAEINRERRVFKNVGCLYCNIDKLLVNEQYPCGYTKASASSGYKAIINMNQESLNGKSRSMWDSRLPYLENGILSQVEPPNIVCESGYLYLLAACRKIYCPRHHYMVDNATCEPLFNDIFGISIYFKIQVDTSITLDDDRDFNELANRLNLILNERLKQAVNVTICHTSLWHLPRLHRNLAISFIFDVDLFDPDTQIIFSQVIERIHSFYLLIHSDSSITLSTGLVIRLKYKFGHAVYSRRWTLESGIVKGDIVTRIALKLLREKGNMHFCGIKMTVSDTNWCYRTSLDLKDTIYKSGFIKQLKHSSELIYKDQFEYLNQSTILICIDLLLRKDTLQKDITPNSDNVPPDIKLHDAYDSRIPWYPTKTAMMTYILLAVLIVVGVTRKVRSLICSDRNEVKTVNEDRVDNYGELQHDETIAEHTSH